VRCIIFLVLTKSEMKWVQAGGRGLRLADGKDVLLLLDHSGTCEELGLFTGIYHDHLDMRDPEEKGQPFEKEGPSKPFKCPKCNAIISAKSERCPICLTVMPKGRTPKHVDGELVVVSEAKKPKPEKTELPRAEWYGGLLWIGQQRGYKPGWAAVKYFAKFGNWPNGMSKAPLPPKPEVTRWETSQRIRWAKSKQKEEVTHAASLHENNR
jgi:DNA repair protein RadD